MTIQKKNTECCFSCTEVKVADVLNGLKDGELPCKHYPPKLATNKDMLKVYFCEDYKRQKINMWKTVKKIQSGIGLSPNLNIPRMRLVAIKSPKDLDDFFRKLFKF